MQLHSSALANHPGDVVPNESRADWVDAELSRTFMANARTGLFSAAISIVVTILMLYGLVSTPYLVAWTAAVVCVSFYREWIVKTYRLRYVRAGVSELNAFFKLHKWSWPCSAALWAALTFLYLDKVPLANQFICMLILVGMGVFSVVLMSARLECFIPYIHALSFTSLCAVLASLLRDGVWAAQQFDVGMIALIGIFWGLLSVSGRRFHAVQRRGFELQYDNEQLIASLRDQTKTAMHAITVKNSLLANAAHDLRQPVHALAFYADWLRSEPELAALVVPKILLATDSVNTLFNSLFDFAKIEAGAVKPKFSAVPVCEIVDDLILQFRPAAFSKNIIFRQHVTPGTVWTDPVLVRRIVGNLLGNAVRYTHRGGVLLTTRLRPGCMWIEVWDTGVGIAPEHQEQVFQEFYKASQHTGTEDGFGLGLAIVRRLSQVLGHKVTMNSRLGRGTCMRLEIALANSDATGPIDL